MGSPVAPVQADSEDTLLTASRANELIDYVNSLANMEVNTTTNTSPSLIVTRAKATLSIPKGNGDSGNLVRFATVTNGQRSYADVPCPDGIQFGAPPTED